MKLLSPDFVENFAKTFRWTLLFTNRERETETERKRESGMLQCSKAR